MGGSYFIERLTRQLAERVGAHHRGRGTRRDDQGDRSRHPEVAHRGAAARTQARIDSGRQAVIGVNKFRPQSPEDIEVLKVDNAAVRTGQLAKLES